MNICEHLTATARVFPDRHALIYEGRPYTYRELDLLSSSAADMLQEACVQPGDRVALMLQNVPAFPVWYYAALRAGAVAITVSSRFTDREVGHVLQDSSPCLFIADAETIEAVSNSLDSAGVSALEVSSDGCSCERATLQTGDSLPWVEREPNDAAAILYTSGTTGKAKGVTLSHMNVRSNVCAFNHLCGMHSDDRILVSLPLFHCFGQNALMNSGFNAGATLVLQRSFDLVEAKQLIASERVTKLFAVPMMFQLMHESCSPSDLAGVGYYFSAAATLPPKLGEDWFNKFNQPIYEGYGLTETSPFASYNHRLLHRPGSIGSPIDGVEMRVVDLQTGEPCEPGTLGEIVVRGPNVMLGYWNNPGETAEALKDGWFRTGDIGRVDSDGYFYLVDRLKDMISTGGLKVYPAEVENALLSHPAVSQAAVVGLPDEVFGEAVAAFVVPAKEPPQSDTLSEEILKDAESRLAHYKVPKLVFFLDKLPRNPSGKVLKTELRERGAALSAGDPTRQPQTSGARAGSNGSPPATSGLLQQMASEYASNRPKVVVAYLQELVQSLTGSEAPPTAETRFIDAGLDSLMIVEVSSRIQQEIGSSHQLPATVVFDYPRVCDLAEFVVSVFDKASATAEPNAPAVGSSTATETTPNASPVRNDLLIQLQSMSEEEATEELMRELDALK